MIKQIFLIKRKQGMSPDAFKAYYLGHHVPLVKAAFPELVKYVINFVQQGKRAAAYDAMTELYWPDFETLKGLKESDAYRTKIAPDELNFMSSEGTLIFLAEEVVAKEVKA